MKKNIAIIALLTAFLVTVGACGKKNEYVLNEGTFFLVMTNMQYYPEQYEGAKIEFDCFTYDITDIDGVTYRCVVRKCSSGYGCNCGKDTVIGFFVENTELPEPKNQSEDTNEKTWLHIQGKLNSVGKKKIKIFSYNADGSVNTDVVETIEFLTFDVENFSVIEDYSGLNYYVTK